VLEKTITNKILKYLRGQGHVVFKINDRSTIGIPDIMGSSSQGRLVALEVKRPGKDGEDIQRYYVNLFSKVGAISAVVRSVEDVKALGL
jgi:RecB family endonuclease NucS